MEHLGVDGGDAARRERDVVRAAVADAEPQHVRAEVELEVERAAVLARHARGRQPARGDVERDVPPVIDERRQRQADLAGDLRPEVQRVARFAPFVERERRPVEHGRRVQGTGKR